MNKIGYFGILVLVLITLMACSEKKSEAEYYEAAYQLYNKNEYEPAINNFKSILDYYPEGEFTARAMFMIGFIYSNHLENYDEAKKYYESFIEKYPDHELATSAKYELDTLGKDINDLPIFKKIKEEEETDADSAKATSAKK